MIQQRELLDKIQLIEGEHNRQEFKESLIQIFQGMKDVAIGFLKIARAAEMIRQKKYYKEIGYSTFDTFCKDVLGLTRKTVYLYLRIDELLSKYPKLFDESFVTRLGSAKMDKLIIGINRIEYSSLSSEKQVRKVEQLVSSVEVNMSVGDVENVVNVQTKSLKHIL